MLLASLLGLCGIVAALPFPQDEDLPPMPYQFTNRVSEDNAELEEEDRGIYWTQDEGAPEDNPGRVEGEYSVWLADGRLMTVIIFFSFHFSLFDRSPTMLMASPALYPPSLIRMAIHQSLITRPIKPLKQLNECAF